jgi:hypothetical protein
MIGLNFKLGGSFRSWSASPIDSLATPHLPRLRVATRHAAVSANPPPPASLPPVQRTLPKAGPSRHLPGTPSVRPTPPKAPTRLPTPPRLPRRRGPSSADSPHLAGAAPRLAGVAPRRSHAISTGPSGRRSPRAVESAPLAAGPPVLAGRLALPTPPDL